jgi:hypothetical protein
MRKLLLSILSVGCFMVSSAQTINILNENDNWAIANGTEFVIQGLSTDAFVSVNFEVVNLTQSPIDFKYRRVRLAHTDGHTDQICDSVVCLDLSDTYQYDRPASYTIGAEDSTDFEVKLAPNTLRGCDIYRYYIMDDANNIYDSVTVKFEVEQTCFLGVEKETPINFSVYPNPADDFIGINVEANGNSVDMELYNILGERILSNSLGHGNNQIDVSNLTNGVYFCTILKNGNAVETKKIVIR